MDEIKIGSVVELKSGGPSMTVQSFARTTEGQGREARNVEDRGRVNCNWFDHTQLLNGTFQVESLTISNKV